MYSAILMTAIVAGTSAPEHGLTPRCGNGACDNPGFFGRFTAGFRSFGCYSGCGIVAGCDSCGGKLGGGLGCGHKGLGLFTRGSDGCDSCASGCRLLNRRGILAGSSRPACGYSSCGHDPCGSSMGCGGGCGAGCGGGCSSGIGSVSSPAVVAMDPVVSGTATSSMTSDCVGAAGCGSVRAIAWYGNGYHAYPNLGCGTGIGAYGGWSGYGIPLPGTQNVDYAGESVIPAPPAVPAGNLPTKTDSPLKDNPPTKLDKGGKGLQPTPIPMNPEKKLILPTPVPVAPGAENPNKKKSILDDDLQARAFITLSVPAGARLFVDGKRIENSTLVRTFRTPPLVAGEAYFYDIRIEFEQDGKTAVENQRVIVTPGQRLAADFRYLSQTVVAGR